MEGSPAASPARVRAAAGRVAIALVVFGVALAITYQGHWGADFRVSVPLPERLVVDEEGQSRPLDPVILTDYRMGVWAFSRHAHTLLRHPTRLFQTEPCHPVEKGLALHHPVITQAIVAIPGQLVTGDPVATTNWLILASALLAAGAMALLVSDWTGVAAAGWIAGLLWAFHPAQIGSPFHLGTKDFTWALLALFFARRLFDDRRWRDAAGLAVCGALQLMTSFYPLLATLVLALPVAVWLVWHHGWRKVPVLPLGAALLFVAGVAAVVFLPYLELRQAGVLQRNLRFFAAWSELGPGGDLFPGWIALALLLAGLGLGRDRVLAGIRGDPRPALCVAALLLSLLATGGNVEARAGVLQGDEPPPFALPNLFAALRGVIPGLDAVRLPSMLAHGTRMLLCLLAGLGAAGLLRLAPGRLAPWIGTALVLAVAVETLRPPPGFSPRVSFTSLEIRPDPERIAFYEKLAEAGNRGPMLELPLVTGALDRFESASLQHMLTAWHHRRTSGCSPSYTPPAVLEVAERVRGLGRPGVLEELRELGFTTLVVHHPPGDARGARLLGRIARLAQSSGTLESVLVSDESSAWEWVDREAGD